MCVSDDPTEVQDAARDIEMRDAGLLGYVCAGKDADMQAPKLPASNEMSADFLYPHEKRYLDNEAKRRKAHGEQSAIKRVDAILRPGMEVLPQALPLLPKRKKGTSSYNS